MIWLDKLEKRLRPFAVPHLTVALIAGQTIVWALSLTRPEILGAIVLIPERVFAGEVWRLVTFLFYPPITNAFFAFFAWYIFYLMGSALEHEWGITRYNIFLLIGYLATLVAAVAASLLTPLPTEATNLYLLESVFLAFGYLFPNFELLLMFILPVKVKWLALLAWLSLIWEFSQGVLLGLQIGYWTVSLLVLAAVLNFFLFFGRDLLLKLRAGRHRVARRAQQVQQQDEPVHRCVVCGVTDKSDPGMDFRYCSRCADSPCYCAAHIRDHPHR